MILQIIGKILYAIILIAKFAYFKDIKHSLYKIINNKNIKQKDLKIQENEQIENIVKNYKI